MTTAPSNIRLEDAGGAITDAQLVIDLYHDVMRSLASAYEDDSWRNAARSLLVQELANNALVKERVTLSSGREAAYYVDAKRSGLSPFSSFLVGVLVAWEARQLGATAVGGLTIGADPVACAALAASDELRAFLVRKQQKKHGLQKWIEGPVLDATDRCLIVDDVVTTGGSVIEAIQHVQDENLTVVGVVSVLDRNAGGRARIEAAARAPYIPLTTIDDVYPGRPDRGA